MSVTHAQLTTDEIASELHRIRAQVIAATLRAFPAIPRAELENAFGDITVDALKRSFPTIRDLVRYVYEALRRDALDIAKSAAFQSTAALSGTIVSVENLEHDVLGHEARELLHEFIAELAEDDRKIAYLHLDPDYDWTPRRIADVLELPRAEVKRTLDRVGIRLRRFTALAIAPGALCTHRRPDVVQWQHTGVMSLPLRLHLRHCHKCRLEQHQAKVAVRSAILPLIPGSALPIAAAGPLTRIYESVVAHPSVLRSNDALARVRRIAPIGGGGGAALAAKLAATTAVITAGAALHAVSASSTPTHPQRHPHALKAHIAAAPPSTPPNAGTTSAASEEPTPTQIPSPAPSSQPTVTQPQPMPTTTSSQPPPAPSQDTAAPAPAADNTVDTTTTTTSDPVSSSPPAPATDANGTGESSTSGGSSSDTDSGPASPGGAPPP